MAKARVGELSVSDLSDEGILSAIRSAVYRFILDQAVDALKSLASSDKLADALFRGDYSDED